MIARATAPQCDRDDLHTLVVALPHDDERARQLLMELRRARIEEVRAIERYLGLPPARSERARKG